MGKRSRNSHIPSMTDEELEAREEELKVEIQRRGEALNQRRKELGDPFGNSEIRASKTLRFRAEYILSEVEGEKKRRKELKEAEEKANKEAEDAAAAARAAALENLLRPLHEAGAISGATHPEFLFLSSPAASSSNDEPAAATQPNSAPPAAKPPPPPAEPPDPLANVFSRALKSGAERAQSMAAPLLGAAPTLQTVPTLPTMLTVPTLPTALTLPNLPVAGLPTVPTAPTAPPVALSGAARAQAMGDLLKSGPITLQTGSGANISSLLGTPTIVPPLNPLPPTASAGSARDSIVPRLGQLGQQMMNTPPAAAVGSSTSSLISALSAQGSGGVLGVGAPSATTALGAGGSIPAAFRTLASAPAVQNPGSSAIPAAFLKKKPENTAAIGQVTTSTPQGEKAKTIFLYK